MHGILISAAKFFDQKKVFRIALFASLAFLFLYIVLGFLGTTVSLESQEAIGNVSRWCERVSGSIFREPANALSNIGFMVAGLFMIRVLSRDLQNTFREDRFYGLTPIAILYAGATIYLGAGSMLMHGTHTSWGGWADNLSMTMYILMPWLINVGEMGRWGPRKFFTIYTTIILFYAFTRWFFGTELGINLDLFDLSIGLWVISEALFRFWSVKLRWLSGFIGFGVAAIFGIMPSEIFSNLNEYWWVILFWIPAIICSKPPTKRRTYTPWGFAGTCSFLLAFVIWLQGYPNTPFCNPDSFIQPHAVWHLTTAFATWCFFKFLRTERDLTCQGR